MGNAVAVFIAIIVIAVIVLIGISIASTKPDAARAPVPKILYFRDRDAGLCFAAIESVTYLGYHVTSITNVPCSEKIH